MRSNESVFHWLTPTQGNAEQRNYPIHGESLILAMTDFLWSPPYSMDSMHAHNCMEIGLCLAGSGTICFGEVQEYAFGPGTVVLVPEGVRHSQQFMGEETARWRYIAVDEARLLRETTPLCREAIARLIAAASPGGMILNEEEMAKDIIWLIQKMFEVKCGYSDEATAQLEAMLLLILTRIEREPQRDQAQFESTMPTTQPIEPALLFIAEQYHTEIKVAQLARSCAMSESYFRKMFVQLMGETPVEYLNRYRVYRAVHMIHTRRGVSVSQIAEKCGFASIATFNRNFLRYTGQNPSEMKKEIAYLREKGPGKLCKMDN